MDNKIRLGSKYDVLIYSSIGLVVIGFISFVVININKIMGFVHG